MTNATDKQKYPSDSLNNASLYRLKSLETIVGKCTIKERLAGPLPSRVFSLEAIEFPGPAQVDGLSDDGTVYGFVVDSGITRGYTWTKEHGFRYAPSQIVQILHRINDGDCIAINSNGERVVLAPDGTVRTLALPSGFNPGLVDNAFISADGTIIGTVISSTSAAFCIWSEPTQPQIFPYPDDFKLGSVQLFGINASNVAVGIAGVLPYDGFCPIVVDFRSQTVSRIDLTNITSDGSPSGTARGINNKGQIVGRSPWGWSEGDPLIGFKMDSLNGPPYKLNARKAYASPEGIDENYNVIGSYFADGKIDAERAFFLDYGLFGYSFYDLTDATHATNKGWIVLSSAFYINKNKQICGVGLYKNSTCAFLASF